MIALTKTVTLSLVRICNNQRENWKHFTKVSDLLRRDVVGLGPHVDLLVVVDAGDDEEHPGTSGTTFEKSAQPEYHRSLVFL